LCSLFSEVPRLQIIGQKPIRVGEQDALAVTAIQYGLTALKYQMSHSIRPDGTLDGIFGPQTHKAVVSFQSDRKRIQPGMTVDGIIGAQTLGAIDDEVHKILKGMKVPYPLKVVDLKAIEKYIEENNVRVPYDLSLSIKQPREWACWAAAATMLYMNAHSGEIPRDLNADGRIRVLLGKLGQKLLNYYEENKGLPTQAECANFWISAMKLQPFSTPGGWKGDFRGAAAWKFLLRSVRGPVVLVWTPQDAKWSHMVLLLGINTIVPSPNYKAPSDYNNDNPFIQKGAAGVADPGSDLLNAFYSVDDIDYMLAPISGGPKYDFVNQRQRVFN
jgi:hypothetical protein